MNPRFGFLGRLDRIRARKPSAAIVAHDSVPGGVTSMVVYVERFLRQLCRVIAIDSELPDQRHRLGTTDDLKRPVAIRVATASMPAILGFFFSPDAMRTGMWTQDRTL